MTFPIPDAYSSEAADIARDETKRTQSPPSFFYSRSWGLVLAASYFTDERLTGGYSAVAAKHRHRIQSASFGQVMASFEWCIKDFVAQVIDATDVYDSVVEDSNWITLDKARVLAQREVTSSIGAMLVHPTQRWHDADQVNQRYANLFKQPLFIGAEPATLERLWILRHSVAHNAGFVTHHDAHRMNASALSEKSVLLDGSFLKETYDFLCHIVDRMGTSIGSSIVEKWMKERSTGDYSRDQLAYERLKRIVTVVTSRNKELPAIAKTDYDADRTAAGL